MWQLERVSMKLDKQIKRYTKWNLWNSTRFDFKIKKKQHHWNKLLWSRMRDFQTDMLWPFNICYWKFIFKQIKILKNFGRWFHSKRMHHLILIIFPKSVLRIASCSVRFAHFFCNIYHFFSISFFELILFFFSC